MAGQGGASRRLIDAYRKALAVEGAQTAALVISIGEEYIAGAMTRLEFEAALVTAEKLGHKAAVRRAVAHVEAVRGAEGAGGRIVEARHNERAAKLRATSTAEALETAATDALKLKMIEKASVWADRATKDGGRRTIRDSAQASGRRWRRVPGADPCTWCAMLATRGFVGEDAGYRSEESALFDAAGDKYHDHCDCVATEILTEWSPSSRAERARFRDFNRVAASLRADDVLVTPDEVLYRMRKSGNYRDSPKKKREEKED